MTRIKKNVEIEEITCDCCGCDIDEIGLGSFSVTARRGVDISYESKTPNGDYCKNCCDEVSNYFSKLMRAGGFLERYNNGEITPDDIMYMVNISKDRIDLKLVEL